EPWAQVEAARDAGMDVVMPASRDRIAPLLRALEPDLVLCAGFPWKIPPDALAVPRLGVVNFHPAMLPRYRGPTPVAWAIRNGESDRSRPGEEIVRQVRAWRFGFVPDGEQGAVTELDGRRVRVTRATLEGPEGRAVECGDGTVWILETEPLSL